jgi:phosphotransferase system  glucose/maltose/N-acetylglucosamine-specific IIC component
VLYAWLSFSFPQLANPAYVYQQIRDNNLTQDVLTMLAMLAPIFLMMIFAIIGIMLGYIFAFMRTQKRLLDIIDRRMNG